jgi:hypothetical protein
MVAPCTSLAYSRQVSSGLPVSLGMPLRPRIASGTQATPAAIGSVVGESGGAPAIVPPQ